MFSHQARVWVQWRQCEAGRAMFSALGQRVRRTLRKLPKASPKQAARRAGAARATAVSGEADWAAKSMRALEWP